MSNTPVTCRGVAQVQAGPAALGRPAGRHAGCSGGAAYRPGARRCAGHAGAGAHSKPYIMYSCNMPQTMHVNDKGLGHLHPEQLPAQLCGLAWLWGENDRGCPPGCLLLLGVCCCACHPGFCERSGLEQYRGGCDCVLCSQAQLPLQGCFLPLGMLCCHHPLWAGLELVMCTTSRSMTLHKAQSRPPRSASNHTALNPKHPKP